MFLISDLWIFVIHRTEPPHLGMCLIYIHSKFNISISYRLHNSNEVKFRAAAMMFHILRNNELHTSYYTYHIPFQYPRLRAVPSTEIPMPASSLLLLLIWKIANYLFGLGSTDTTYTRNLMRICLSFKSRKKTHILIVWWPNTPAFLP
jgi:hypothetical protein